MAVVSRHRREATEERVRRSRRGGLVIAVGAAALTAAAAVGAARAASGIAGEGPFPWRYPASGSAVVGTGTTVSGTACSASAGQFASPYAAQCIAHFKGSNGGATSNGVTGSTITVVQREFPITANIQQ